MGVGDKYALPCFRPVEKQWSVTHTNRDMNGLVVVGNYLYITGYKIGGMSLPVCWSTKKLNKVTGSEIWSIEEDDPPRYYDKARAICSDGSYIYVCGYDAETGWRIEKRNLDGELQWMKNDSDTAFEDLLAIDVDDSYIYAVGQYEGTKWCIIKKAKSNGVTDWKIGGTLETNGSQLWGVKIYGDSLLVCGIETNPPTEYWKSERRDKSDGDVVWSKLSNASTLGYNIPYAIITDGTNVFISGADEQPGENPWGLESREFGDGDLNYYVKDEVTVAVDVAFTNDIFDSNHLLVGGYEGGASPVWRMTKVLKSDGSNVWEKTDFGSGSLRSLKVDSSGIYATGHNMTVRRNL